MTESLRSFACGSIDLDALNTTILTARKSGVYARALCIINPGNPTGQVLGKSEMEAVVRVCEEYRLVLLADEVRTRQHESDQIIDVKA